MSEIVTHARPFESIGFVERESKNGKQLHFKCGRDFIYFCLNFYFPETFNPHALTPVEIDRQHLFGIPVPKYLAWTQLQFLYLPNYLASKKLSLFINNRKIESYFSFVFGNLFSRISYDEAMASIEHCVRQNTACAIDIPIRKVGPALLDHVLFVHGFDAENLYVCDTLTVPDLEYQKINQSVHYYKLSRSVIRKNWSIFGRVWRVE